jgi:ubiquitin-like protein 4
MPRPLTKKQKLAPGQERSLSVTVKSLRNPPLDITLPSLPLSTSILSLKDSISEQTSIPTAKLRLLWNKKPVQDSKTLKDVVGEEYEGVKVELGVMVIGGAAGVVKREEVEVEPKVVGVGSGGELLKTEEFWGDLRAFLVQRLKDEGEGERVWGVFRKAVEGEK